MSDRMTPIPFEKLLNWIVSEYLRENSIFGIPENMFFRKKNSNRVRVFSDEIDTAVGPAAGPHTQLAQNIVSAYLTGGRFIELKTVQKLDNLEIEKPCIDVRDEGYNTEWSTELSLVQAYDEYVKAWVILHFLEELFSLSLSSRTSFIFNMSIGYDLEGIKTEGMNSFIDGLIDAEKRNYFFKYIEKLKYFIDSLNVDRNNLSDRISENVLQNLKSLPDRISPKIVKSVTLSTMHGCPPDEIEAICTYLLKEKELNTYVKLNPTLLGYERVKEILGKNGYSYILLKEESFLHDLQYGDAIKIIANLEKLAGKLGLYFGLKLSNTLGTVNPGEHLPGEEMYMSGRALFPLTINLAAILSREFEGKLEISYSGGASQLNVAELLATGIRPITFATELLKPGGYLRLKEAAEILENKYGAISGKANINVNALERLAEDSIGNILYSKQWRGSDTVSVHGTLPLTDCYVAPCHEACPVGQDIPNYIQLAGEKDYDNSLSLIRTTNPLPGVTGYICEQPCATKCTRLDYDKPVLIRDVKLKAFLKGKPAEISVGLSQTLTKFSGLVKSKRVAVVGAGPAGLACAYYLGLAGVDVTVFDRRESAGGVVNHVLPDYRLPPEAVERDIKEIERLGVKFRFNVKPSPAELKDSGFDYIFLGVGAEISRHLESFVEIEDEEVGKQIIDALSFLSEYRIGSPELKLGRKVAVIGGGNTAMDAARSALRVDGVEEVTVYYRRSEREMPADREEYENAKKDGVIFNFLLSPVKVMSQPDGSDNAKKVKSKKDKLLLVLERMSLGETDESGRRRPVPTGEREEVFIDTIIEAIGETVDSKLLDRWGLKLDRNGKPWVNVDTLETSVSGVYIGGDAYRGPSSVVQAMSDGKRAADSILKAMGLERGIASLNIEDVRLNIKNTFNFDLERIREIYSRKGKVYGPDELISSESERCLECDFLCNKCVDVCPNRANVAVHVESEYLKNYYQIIHMDALCNECGNCGTFCPWEGLPYRDKFTVFSSQEDFENSRNNGFMLSDKGMLELRLNGRTRKIKVKDTRWLEDVEALSVDFGVSSNVLYGIKDTIESILSHYQYLVS